MTNEKQEVVATRAAAAIAAFTVVGEGVYEALAEALLADANERIPGNVRGDDRHQAITLRDLSRIVVKLAQVTGEYAIGLVFDTSDIVCIAPERLTDAIERHIGAAMVGGKGVQAADVLIWAVTKDMVTTDRAYAIMHEAGGDEGLTAMVEALAAMKGRDNAMVVKQAAYVKSAAKITKQPWLVHGTKHETCEQALVRHITFMSQQMGRNVMRLLLRCAREQVLTQASLDELTELSGLPAQEQPVARTGTEG